MELERLHYTMREAAQRFGLNYAKFAEKVREGILRPPMKIIGNGPKAVKLFPKRAFDDYCLDATGVIEIDTRRMGKARRIG